MGLIQGMGTREAGLELVRRSYGGRALVVRWLAVSSRMQYCTACSFDSSRKIAQKERMKKKRRDRSVKKQETSSVLFPTDYSPVLYYCRGRRLHGQDGQVVQPLPFAAFEPAEGRRLESVSGLWQWGADGSCVLDTSAFREEVGVAHSRRLGFVGLPFPCKPLSSQIAPTSGRTPQRTSGVACHFHCRCRYG